MNKTKLHFLLLFFLCCLLLLAGRLSLLSGKENYASVSQSQVEQERSLLPQRGIFYDRNGQPLRDTLPRHFYLADPDLVDAEELNRCGLPLLQEEKNKFLSNRIPLLCSTSLSFPLSAENGWTTLSINAPDPADQTALHLLGQLREGSGISGLEGCFDPFLSQGGNTIKLCWSANALGGIQAGTKPVLKQRVDQTGVMLTIDKEIQLLCQQAIERYGKPSGIVVLECQTGEILAAASYPLWNPINPADDLTRSDSPFFNRVLASYDAGSIFKIVTTAAALEAGYSTSLILPCQGAYSVGEVKIGCSKQTGHGQISMETAFSQSCNPYFCALGEKIGGTALLTMAKKLGLGRFTPLTSVNEFCASSLTDSGGALPSSAQLEHPAALALFSFGQGDLQVTPLQMAAVLAAVGNGGVYHSPHLIKGLIGADGNKLDTGDTFRPSAGSQVFSKKTAQTLLSLLTLAVEKGSGSFAKSRLLSLSGKTGTAETGWVSNGEEMVHGWFVGCAPAGNPKYAIAVFCENGKSGALASAPIFKEVAEGIWKLKG